MIFGLRSRISLHSILDIFQLTSPVFTVVDENSLHSILDIFQLRLVKCIKRIPLPLHSILDIFQCRYTRRWNEATELYIPFWIYSNEYYIVAVGEKVALHSILDIFQSKTTLWGLAKKYYFTFHSGYIPIPTHPTR